MITPKIKADKSNNRQQHFDELLEMNETEEREEKNTKQQQNVVIIGYKPEQKEFANFLFAFNLEFTQLRI